MKKLLSIMLSVLMVVVTISPFAVHASSGTTADGFEYKIVDGEIMISGHNKKTSPDIVIPDIIEGLPVTRIGKHTFDSLASYCTSVTIPKTVTEIEADTFMRCKKLTSLYIESLESWLQIKLKNLYSHPFSASGSGDLYLNGELLNCLEIPENTQTINDYAFYGCSIEELVLSEELIEIGNYAFYKCNMEELILPDGLVSICDYAFYDCPIKSIIMHESVTFFGTEAFGRCTKAWVYYFGDKAAWDAIKDNFDSYALHKYDISGLTDDGIIYQITENKEITILGFCNYGTEIIIPSEIEGFPVVSIGFHAVRLSKSIESLYIPSCIKSIDYSGFSSASSTDIGTIYYDGGPKQLESLYDRYPTLEQQFNVVYNIVPMEGLALLGGNDIVELEKEQFYTPMFEYYPDNTTDSIVLYTESDCVFLYDYDKIYARKPGEAKVIAKADSGVTCEFTVRVIGYTELIIDFLPEKLYYNMRSSLDTSGLQVTAYKNNGESNEVTEYTVSGYNALKKGIQTITVTYEDCIATFDVFVSDAIVGDVNLDGSTSAVDSNYLKRIIVGNMAVEEYTDGYFVCDMNGDGEINAMDSALLKRSIAGV